MQEPKNETVKWQGKEFDIYSFSNPMFHEDWHKVEETGLVYLYYAHNGPDYWDDEMIFCKGEDKEIAKKWCEEAMWGEF
jgi:hypothetical protein